MDLAPGLTALVGANGEGKTNLLEALAWLATLSSFRGAPTEALVRRGRAVRRRAGARPSGRGASCCSRPSCSRNGRNRVQVNRQPLRRARDLLGSLRVTVFTPDDLAIVKGGPGERRRFLDDVLVALHPRNDALRTEVDRVLRQRNALLQAGGRAARRGRRRSRSTCGTPSWRSCGRGAGRGPAATCSTRMRPVLAATYDALARRPADVTAVYEAAWARGRAGGLDRQAPSRTHWRRPWRRPGEDVRRGVSTVGAAPRRGGAGDRRRPGPDPGQPGRAADPGAGPAPGRAPRGDRGAGAPPVLLLDDVFSELDPDRADGAAGPPAGGPDAADDRGRAAAGRRARPGPAGSRATPSAPEADGCRTRCRPTARRRGRSHAGCRPRGADCRA